VTVYVGLAIFVAFSLFMLYYSVIALFGGYILFVISGIFVWYIVRLVLVRSWEKRERKIVMQEWKKFYVIPHPPQFHDKQTVD
jgi:uncharacterized SAM-binding protein YcdF (DUF218 family)